MGRVLQLCSVHYYKFRFPFQDYEEPQQEIILNVDSLGFEKNASNWSLIFNISGHFLGITEIKAELKLKDEIRAEKKLNVYVTRKKTIQSKIFAYSVAILVSLAYINIGCAMDIEVVKNTLKKPIGPAIGFISQFLIMPLLAYALGFIFGTKSAAMRLGIFVTVSTLKCFTFKITYSHPKKGLQVSKFFLVVTVFMRSV